MSRSVSWQLLVAAQHSGLWRQEARRSVILLTSRPEGAWAQVCVCVWWHPPAFFYTHKCRLTWIQKAFRALHFSFFYTWSGFWYPVDGIVLLIVISLHLINHSCILNERFMVSSWKCLRFVLVGISKVWSVLVIGKSWTLVCHTSEIKIQTDKNKKNIVTIYMYNISNSISSKGEK